MLRPNEQEPEANVLFAKTNKKQKGPEQDSDKKQLRQQEKSPQKQEKLQQLEQKRNQAIQKKLQKKQKNSSANSKQTDEKQREESVLRGRTQSATSIFQKNKDKKGTPRVSQDREVVFDALDSEKKGERPDSSASKFKLIRGGKRNRQTQAIVLCSAISVFLVLIAVLNLLAPAGLIEGTKVFFAGIGRSGGFPIQRSSTAYSELRSCGSDAVLLTDSSVFCYTSSGKLVYTQQHTYQNPAISTSASRTIVYDRSGAKYMVLNRTGVLYEDKAQGDIITATVGDDGSFAISTYSEEYVSVVTVYGANGKKKFQFKSSECYITSLALSPNGRRIGVGEVKAQGGEYLIRLKVFSVTEKEPLTKAELSGSFLLSLSWLHENSLGAVTDNGYFVMDADGKTKSYPYHAEQLVSFDNTNSSHTALLLTRYHDANNHMLVVIDETGTVCMEREYSEPALSIACSNRYLFVLSKGSASRIPLNGKGEKSTEINPDSTQLIACGAKAIVMGASMLDKASF